MTETDQVAVLLTLALLASAGTATALADGPGEAKPSIRLRPVELTCVDDEFDVYTWLSSFLVKEGKVHFLYRAQTDPPRQHYTRFDVATGKRDVHLQPEFRGETIRLGGLDGFFAASPDREGSPLYCLMQDGGRVACLVSRDNGLSWHDFARSEETFNIYSLGGCRTTSDNGHILGTFTDQHGSNLTPDRKSRVCFFKIKAEDRVGVAR